MSLAKSLTRLIAPSSQTVRGSVRIARITRSPRVDPRIRLGGAQRTHLMGTASLKWADYAAPIAATDGNDAFDAAPLPFLGGDPPPYGLLPSKSSAKIVSSE